jgi:hypothetical protein
MPARALSDATVRSLKADSDQRLVVEDAVARGLCLRVTARTRSWSFVYRPNGRPKQRRFTIGDYPPCSLSQARDKAPTLRRRVQERGDRVEEERTRRDALTLTGMVDRFIAANSKRLRSWADYKGLLDRDVVPVLGGRLAADVPGPT